MFKFSTFYLWVFIAGLSGSLADNNYCDVGNQCSQSIHYALQPLDADISETKAEINRIQAGQKILQDNLRDMKIELNTHVFEIFNKMNANYRLVQIQLENQSCEKTITRKQIDEELQVFKNKIEERLQELENNQQMLIGLLLEKQTKLESQQKNIDNSLKKIINQPDSEKSCESSITKEEFETKLQELNNLVEEQLILVQNTLQAHQLKLEGPKPEVKATPSKTHLIVPPKFEKISGRYFYIEKDIKKNWNEAAETCRRMGGYLAAIENETEFEALNTKLDYNSPYWLGINDIKKEGEFVSLASGKPAKFWSWESKQNFKNTNCVRVLYGKMSVTYCNHPNFFICQADNQI